MPRLLLHFCIVVTVLCGQRHNARAAQWQKLEGTTRYSVAYDASSIRLTPRGSGEILFRFIPRGKPERKLAAAEYKEKRYNSHLEYYEIDCSERTARLRTSEILGPSKIRLKLLRGGGQPEPIRPGSVLESAEQRICPIPSGDGEEDNESVEPEPPEEPDTTSDTPLSREKLQLIDELRKKATSKDGTAEAWKELGNVYFDTDQPEQAIMAYERVLALKPDDVDTLNDRGAMYRQKGDFQQALADFEKAFSIDPHNLESLYNGGYVCAFDLNNIPKALVLWRRYLEQETASETARQVRAFIEQYEK